MSKKPPPPPPQEGAPEWMVSYADMITIMMAFFVVMYAMAPKRDEEKKESPTQQLMNSIYKRFGPDYEPFGCVLELTAVRRSRDRHPGYGKLDQDPVYTDDEEVTSRRDENVIRIPGRGRRTMVGNIFRFAGHSTELSPEERTRLEQLARELAGTPHKIEILAHTSRLPLPADSPIQDHWSLAYQRGWSVMQLLTDMGIDPDRMRVISAGSSEPVYIGTDPTRIEVNSRVEVYMVDLHARDLVGTRSKRKEEVIEPASTPGHDDAHGAASSHGGSEHHGSSSSSSSHGSHSNHDSHGGHGGHGGH